MVVSMIAVLSRTAAAGATHRATVSLLLLLASRTAAAAAHRAPVPLLLLVSRSCRRHPPQREAKPSGGARVVATRASHHDRARPRRREIP